MIIPYSTQALIKRWPLGNLVIMGGCVVSFVLMMTGNFSEDVFKSMILDGWNSICLSIMWGRNSIARGISSVEIYQFSPSTSKCALGCEHAGQTLTASVPSCMYPQFRQRQTTGLFFLNTEPSSMFFASSR